MATRSSSSQKEEKKRLEWFQYFSLRCVLYSKIETGLSGNGEADEAIDTYLEKLLSLSTDLRGFDLKEIKKQLTKYDSDAFSRLAWAERGRIKYQIYRTKADLLLLSFTTVDNQPPSKRFPCEKAAIGRKGDYCLFSYTFSHTINKVSREGFSITDILEKLLLALEKYSKIISCFKGGPFNLSQCLAEGTFYQLERVVDEAGRREALREKQDQLLELLSRWKKRRSAQVEEEIRALIEEIKGLKPEFSFSLPEEEGR